MAMSERELEAELMMAISWYKDLEKAQSATNRDGKKIDSLQVCLEVSVTKIAIELILDFHRIAEAVEHIASHGVQVHH